MPIIRYVTLYKFIKLFITDLLFWASGLYRLKIIALPMPNSASDKIVKILVNKPFKPKYSEPRRRIKISLAKKEMMIPVN